MNKLKFYLLFLVLIFITVNIGAQKKFNGQNISENNLTSTEAIIECKTFICRNRYCIPNHYRCDGSIDCADGSDEEDCGI